MKIVIFHSEFLQNINLNASIVACFQKFSPGAKCPIASVYVYNNYFLYKNMLIFREFYKTQSDQNINQNAPNFQNFLRELAYAPETSSIYVQL